MKKLPIGISTLRDILEGGYAYVDKTAHVLKLTGSGKYYFLSRPRRFGKSLLINTLAEVFSGHEALFRGLHIHPHWDWSVKYPVIHISFGTGVLRNRAELDRRIRHILKENQEHLQLAGEDREDVSSCFAELIRQAKIQHGQGAVILIDEYDKPILDNITEPEIAAEMRNGLRNFYSVIKDSDEHTIRKEESLFGGAPLYHLGYPNKEVRYSLNEYLLEYYLTDQIQERHSVYQAFMKNDFAALQQRFTALFASIANGNYRKNPIAEYEGYYAAVMYAYLCSLGIDAIAEDASSRGRIDLTLRFKLPSGQKQVYIFEFKVIDGEEGALRQLQDKQYAAKALEGRHAPRPAPAAAPAPAAGDLRSA
ncbi:AAA family ATPase [Thiothrix nivea]|uniref:AAA-ATPase-like protein n=1 Tax=Thiothrix nivea (strain ATCC 35100 / DSM 5205 / JP2) TaxID=870187 RepID=A0A656HL06_THINJ|nr:AAA family ATPase [Thiothrix nivea]EIJ36186.1 AAA-ATPase-like protein [Thiothrix nivea DSM 5205]